MSVIDEIKDRLDIVEVIQSYVPLKKAGRSYKGLCPFHAEKTPSFVVFPHTGTWHCFGACNTGGDVFTFIMKQENLDFGEALKVLAPRAGVELEPRSPEIEAAEQRLALLRKINQAAAAYFHHLLWNSDEASRSRTYLADRGLNRETLEHFQVGYALDRWDALLNYLTGKGFSLADIAEVGLIVERETETRQAAGRGYYDRFRGRIMFPIHDHQGRTIGFGGRVLGDGVPKYLNSPQSPLFDKSSVLFGLDLAKVGIRTTGQAVIVEGYMDVLMAHQYGINNVLAQMGTALTEAQLQRLKRYTQRFILALDSDVAGGQATLRGLDVARRVMDREVVPVPTAQGLIRFEDRLAADIRIVSLPKGRDPDEVIREDPARWAELIAGARPVMDYYFDALTDDLDLATAQGKAEATRRLGPLVVELGDRVQRTHYLQQLARIVQVDERVLWQQIQRATGQDRSERLARSAALRSRQPVERTHRDPLGQDAYCLSSVLLHPNLLALADEVLQASEDVPLQPEDMSRPDDRAILTAWRQWLLSGGSPDVRGEFYDTLDENLQHRVDSLVQYREALPSVPEDLVQSQVVDAITNLRLRNLLRQNEELRFLQEAAQAVEDRDASRSYGQLTKELATRILRLQRSLNARSISGRRQHEDVAARRIDEMLPRGV
jgi:DNA primase